MGNVVPNTTNNQLAVSQSDPLNVRRTENVCGAEQRRYSVKRQQGPQTLVAYPVLEEDMPYRYAVNNREQYFGNISAIGDRSVQILSVSNQNVLRKSGIDPAFQSPKNLISPNESNYLFKDLTEYRTQKSPRNSMNRSAQKPKENFYNDVLRYGRTPQKSNGNQVPLSTENSNKQSIFGDDLYRPTRYAKSSHIFLKDGQINAIERPKEVVIQQRVAETVKLSDFDELIKQNQNMESAKSDKNIRLYSKAKQQKNVAQNVYIQTGFAEQRHNDGAEQELRNSFVALRRGEQGPELFKSSIQIGRFDPRSPAPKNFNPSNSMRPASRGNSIRKYDNSPNQSNTLKRVDNEFDPSRVGPKVYNQGNQPIANHPSFPSFPSSFGNHLSGRNELSTMRLQNEPTFNGFTKNEIPGGLVKEEFSNGNAYEGEYRRGQRDEQGAYRQPGDYEHAVSFKDVRFGDAGVKSYSNKDLFPGNFKQDKQEGYSEQKDRHGNVISNRF